MAMRIGFDASVLGRRGGIATYTESLLEAIARLAQATRWFCGVDGSWPSRSRIVLPWRGQPSSRRVPWGDSWGGAEGWRGGIP